MDPIDALKCLFTSSGISRDKTTPPGPFRLPNDLDYIREKLAEEHGVDLTNVQIDALLARLQEAGEMKPSVNNQWLDSLGETHYYPYQVELAQIS